MYKLKINKKIIFIIVGMVIIGSNFIPNISSDKPSFRNTIYVGGSGPGNHSTIQSAIDAASSEDNIFVYNNTYYENVLVDKKVNLIGENKNNTIIDGSAIRDTVNITVSGINFSGFSVMFGGEGCSPYYSGIHLHADGNIIFDNIIKRNSDFGIRINSNNNIIYGNIFFGNCGEGIYITNNSNNNLLYNNIFMDNVYDNGINKWNISKTLGTNIVGGPYLGGNYWHDYIGVDIDNDVFGDINLPHNNSGYINNSGDLLPLLYPKSSYHISDIEKSWNLISLPFNQSISLDEFIVIHNNSYYSWIEAIDPVKGPIVDPNVYGWNRDLDIYFNINNIINPGFGYWIFVYENCELWLYVINLTTDTFITNLNQSWNMVGVSDIESINTTDLIVHYLGVDYTWLEAIDPANGPIVDPNLYSWDRINGMYIPAGDTLLSGYAYWMFAYSDCVLKRINS